MKTPTEIKGKKKEPWCEQYSFDLGGDYETLDVERTTEDGRITIKMNEGRWRTPQETIDILSHVIILIKQHLK